MTYPKGKAAVIKDNHNERLKNLTKKFTMHNVQIMYTIGGVLSESIILFEIVSPIKVMSIHGMNIVPMIHREHIIS